MKKNIKIWCMLVIFILNIILAVIPSNNAWAMKKNQYSIIRVDEGIKYLSVYNDNILLINNEGQAILRKDEIDIKIQGNNFRMLAKNLIINDENKIYDVFNEEFLDEETIDKFEDIIIESKNIFVTGAGRSGLAAKAFAMRLMHLGLSAYVVGETISPAIYEDDCIIAISGSGETNTIVSAAKIAKNRGSKVLAVTSYPESTLGKLSDAYVFVKGRTKKEVDDENYMKRQIHGNYTSLTPLGTAFELTTLVFLDAIVSELMEKMQQTESDLKARHTVLE